MRSLEKARSIFIASSASLTLRENDSSLVRRKFLATCWVMVEAPCGRRPAAVLLHVEHGGAGDAGEVDAAVLVYMTSLRLNGSIRGEAEHDYPMSSNWQSMSTCSAPNRAPSSI
jgi:hypothetical protein